MTRLIAMTDDDFAWLLGETARGDLSVVDGGIAPDEVTAMLRGVAASVGEGRSHPVAWLIVDGTEVVGMISFTRATGERRFEIGYGVAPTREGRGHTRRAVAALIGEATASGVAGLTAETSVANPASQAVLARNGFVRTGTRHDDEDGDLIAWAYEADTNR